MRTNGPLQAGLWSVRSSRTVMILVAIAACEPVPEASNQRAELDPIIEVRLVSEEAAPGLETMVYEGETLHLDPVPILSDPDLVHVEPFLRPGEIFLRLELDPEASERAAARTESEIGRRLAIIVDSQVRSVPEIRTATGPFADMPIRVSNEEGRRLADLVRSRWSPDTTGSG